MTARGGGRAWAAALLGVLAAAAPASSETYRELVADYVHRDAKAVERLASWPRPRLQAELKGLRESLACPDCREREAAERFPFLGAALLHTDLAFRDDEAGRREDRDFHLDFARALLESAPDEARRFEPRWFLVAGHHFLRMIDMPEAHRYFEAGSSRFPRDPRFAVGDGAAFEQDARLVPPPDVVYSSGERTTRLAFDDAGARRHALVQAESSFRRALQLDPGSAEARLRRGRVLVDLDRRQEGARELGWVMDHVAVGGLHALAALFRGQAEEKSGRAEAAAALYREAVRTGPPGARGAGIALARALDHLGRGAEAQAIVDGLLAQPGEKDPFDLYILGPAGEMEELVEELRAAARGTGAP